VAESCDHSNEPLGSTKGAEFFNYVSDCQLLKKDSDPWSSLIMPTSEH
jgi:hypothetical protein